MGVFMCGRCASNRHSDDGCEEYMAMLICAECALDIKEEQDADASVSPAEGRTSNPTAEA